MMTFIRGSFVALMATGFFLAPLPVGANIGPLQMFKGGGVVVPLSPHQSIRLDSEQVIISLGERSYAVDAVFNLFNTGETTTECVGFPKWVASRTPTYPTFISFQGSVNGRPIEFNEKWDPSGGSKPSFEEWRNFRIAVNEEERQWVVSQVTFSGHATTTIRVTYEAPYNYANGYREASYIYGTGALWKDNIRKAVFIVDSSGLGGTEKISTYFEHGFGSQTTSANVKSAPRPIWKNSVRYEIKDFKPHPEAHIRIKGNRFRGGVYQKAHFGRLPLIYPPPPPMLPPPKPFEFRVVK